MVKMKTFFLCVILIISKTEVLAQQSKNFLNIGVQKKLLPSFKLNNDTFQQKDIYEYRLVMNILQTFPFSVEYYFSHGYNPSMDYAYGGSLSYIFFSKTNYWLKVGLRQGKLKMGSFKTGYEVGDIHEDDYHENSTPFIEFNFKFNKRFNISFTSGYRFLRSQTDTVVAVKERYDNGSPSLVTLSRNDKLYRSGFEIGIGIDLIIF